MHKESFEKMAELLNRFSGSSADEVRCLDVGALDVNGTYRELVESHGWKYTGLDFQAGPNVDVVTKQPNKFPLAAGDFDIILCGNMLANADRPWKLIPEMVRVLRPGGLLAVVTIWRWNVSAYPEDYWRFLAPGLRVLLEDTGKLEQIEVAQDSLGNSWGSAFKS